MVIGSRKPKELKENFAPMLLFLSIVYAVTYYCSEESAVRCFCLNLSCDRAVIWLY
jgi:hypothetical protein